MSTARGAKGAAREGGTTEREDAAAGRAGNRAREKRIRELASVRWRVATSLSACVFLLYFGFLGLAAFAKDTMATELVPGLSVGIVLGALVIFGSWCTTFVYARWAASHLDKAREAILREPQALSEPHA